MNKFSKKFYWGSATSAHQVEGDNKNSDWWEWEKEGKVANHEKSGKACEFWDRYKSDLKFAKELGHNAFRFSIEWAKVISKEQRNPSTSSGQASEQESEMSLREVKRRSNLEIDRYTNALPVVSKAQLFQAGRDDKKMDSCLRGSDKSRIQDDPTSLKAIQDMQNINWGVIEHYQDVVDYCHKLGLEPFVTLWHFTNPEWFANLGGWEKNDNVKYFLEYVDLVTKKIKGVKYWITINEPCVYASGSYHKGVWPPGRKNIFSAIKVVKNMIYAHNEAYNVVKKNQPKAMIGLSKNNAYFEGGVLAKWAKKYWNDYFLENTKFDFIGLNYYFHDKLKLGITPPFVKTNNKNELVSDMNWEIYPEGIYHVLMDLKKYKKPVIVTENGVADQKDVLREKFIRKHLKYVSKAMISGVDVRGYLYWSLLDNFEWAHGYKPRFGLIEVNYQTQKRTIRKSAFRYKNIIKSGKI